MSISLKSKLSTGDRILVVNIDYSNAGLVEHLGVLGVDAVFIDCEQGDTGVESVADLVRAARLSGTASLLRLFSPEPWVIERYMARGVDGIVVPRLDSAAQVRSVVNTVKYCYPNDFKNKIVVVQIESRAAAAVAEEIVDIEGVDVFFIGPVDLSKSMGFDGRFSDGPVAEQIESLISRIRSKNRVVGMLVDERSIRHYSNLGVQFFYLHTKDLLRLGSEQLMLLVNS